MRMGAMEVMERGRIESAAAVVRDLAAMAGEVERLRAENEEMARRDARLVAENEAMGAAWYAVKRVLGDAYSERMSAWDVADALRSRLMPGGYEWPRFEDGEPVKSGDDIYATWYDRETSMQVDAIAFTAKGIELHDSTRDMPMEYGYGERVKRPQSEVKSPHCSPIPPNAPKLSELAGTCEDPDEKADSWEKLEKDIELFGRYYAGTDPDENDREAEALVRRARALAGEGE